MTYAIVSVTDWLSTGSTYRVIGVTDDLDKAHKRASKHRPDYDQSVGAHRLSHNQASPTRGEVWLVVRDGDVDEMDELEAESDGNIVAQKTDADGFPIETYILMPL